VRRRSYKQWEFVLGACLYLICCGCQNSERAHVSGTIKGADGKPIIGARIVARDEATGKSGSGTTDGSGHYELGVESTGDGIPPGNYRVLVVEDLGDWDHPNRPTISRMYSDPATSGLEFSVESGDSKTFDAELKAP
jgi:hypothetical protein